MTRIEARARVQKHVKTKGRQGIEITERKVRHWWKVLNKAVFDEELTMPKKFIIRRFHFDTLGYCDPINKSKHVRMGIRSDLPTREVFLTVLAHEMVHQKEWEEKQHIAHGPFFYGYRDKIKECTGLHLSRLVDVEV